MRNPFGGGGQFMMMPFPFGQMMPDQQDIRPQVPDIIVPARVRIAMEFLNSLTVKGMTRAAVYESGAQEIKGQNLSDEEADAQATACNLLSQYFAGKLPPDQWESLRVDALKKQAATGEKNQKGMVLNCVMCSNRRQPRRDCPLCEGSGVILVVGAKADTGQGDDGNGLAAPDDSE